MVRELHLVRILHHQLGLAPGQMHRQFEITEALMTTVHAMTATQAVVDSSSVRTGVEDVPSADIIPSSGRGLSPKFPSSLNHPTGIPVSLPLMCPLLT
jgi:glyceraldehyde 3-phosphate dehydrogenase